MASGWRTEAKSVTSPGIWAADGPRTVLAAIDRKTRPAALARPGHMFPLKARDGGVLVRAGQTEAAVDLARIAGLYPAGVICEIMNEDGDRKSTRLNSSHQIISYAVFCLKKKKKQQKIQLN